MYRTNMTWMKWQIGGVPLYRTSISALMCSYANDCSPFFTLFRALVMEDHNIGQTGESIGWQREVGCFSSCSVYIAEPVPVKNQYSRSHTDWRNKLSVRRFLSLETSIHSNWTIRATYHFPLPGRSGCSRRQGCRLVSLVVQHGLGWVHQSTNFVSELFCNLTDSCPYQRLARNKNDPEHWLDYGTFCLLIGDMCKVS